MKILYATDGSENAEAAARCLAKICEGTENEIIMLSVIDLPPLNYVMNKEAMDQEYVEQQKELIEKDFDHAEKILSLLKQPIERKVVIGHIGQEIVAQANSLNVDLIVVGAVGRSLIDRVLLGNVGEHVATHSDCSVLVVRPTDKTRYDKWLIASDGSQQASSTLEEIVQAGFLKDGIAEGLQVLEPPPSVLTGEDAKQVRKALLDDAENDLKCLHEICENHSVDWTQHTLESSHAGNAICDFAEKSGSEVIVVGNTGKGIVARVLVGSVSRFVLQHAPCSVWIGRDKRES
jgi:nucleotide-binding universal stress UspA family protein